MPRGHLEWVRSKHLPSSDTDDPLCVAVRSEGKVMYKPVRDLNGILGAKDLIMCLTANGKLDGSTVFMSDLISRRTNFSRTPTFKTVGVLVCWSAVLLCWVSPPPLRWVSPPLLRCCCAGSRRRCCGAAALGLAAADAVLLCWTAGCCRRWEREQVQEH
ncbi:hypothetical protein Ancab_035431 [Ancistrocladus abbreviatus]